MILHREAIAVRPGQFPQRNTDLPSVTPPIRVQAQSTGQSRTVATNRGTRGSGTAGRRTTCRERGWHINGGPQRDAAGNDARHLAQTEQSEQRNREGDEPTFSQIPPSDRAKGISGEQLTQGRESIADQVEELVQEERHSREQADTPARLDVSRAHAVDRRVTEIPVYLPSLIAQLREGSQLDAGVPPPDTTSVARPEYEASLRPLPLEPVAQSTEEGRPGSDLDGTNLLRSPRRGPRIGPQPPQPDGAVRKPRKNPTTRREINWAGTRDAAIADESWGSDGGGDGAGGITAETTAVSPQDAERYPAVLPDQSRPNWKPLQDKRAKITSLILRILKKTALLRSLLGATEKSQNRPR